MKKKNNKHQYKMSKWHNLATLIVKQRGMAWLGTATSGVAWMPTRGSNAIRAILSHMFVCVSFYQRNKLRE
jgi:hypothetical protein